MKGKILVEPHVDTIKMPDNLRIGLMVSEHRKKCRNLACNFDYFGFAFGQSPFHVPPPIAQALCENAKKGHYSDAEGIPELREAIAGFNKRHFGLDPDPGRIIVGPGTKDLIHIIFDIVQGGVIIPSPSWIGYSPQVKLLDKHFHTFHLKPEFDYRIQPADLDMFLSGLPGGQHILVLNNPHNPTGIVYTRQELEQIADVCREHDTLVLADEIYALTTYASGNFTSMGLVYPEGTFVTNGLSKDRSSGGYRLGSCILPDNDPGNLRDDFTKVAATVYTNVSTPTQFAAVTAYEPNEEIEEYFMITREIHRIMGEFMSTEFNRINGIKATTPEGGFYFFADFNQLSGDLRRSVVMTSNELMDSLISHPHHIATVTGDACLLEPGDYGARIAFVDYDGKEVFEKFRLNPPKTKDDELEFVKRNAPKMVNGARALREYVDYIKATK
ncbi:MAG: aminotransferase class I/II-fold pyridoxal phosphate-dependent enzyme [Candidatus Methanoperedens sp.]|nr:aminotransferase class I/II-fold pyridoxal phosphate-dependent enzyme [Candidatus Methanoperedens sp.]